MKHTEKQIQDYLKYEHVRQRGLFNMFDPRARHVAGLTKEECVFVMDNYDTLQEAAQQTKPTE